MEGTRVSLIKRAAQATRRKHLRVGIFGKRAYGTAQEGLISFEPQRSCVSALSSGVFRSRSRSCFWRGQFARQFVTGSVAEAEEGHLGRDCLCRASEGQKKTVVEDGNPGYEQSQNQVGLLP